MFNIKNILVPTDFSTLSQSALEYARDLSDNMNATIHILHVIDKSIPFLPGNKNLSDAELTTALEADAQKHLSPFKKEIESESDINVICMIKHGIDFEEIVKYAKEIRAELIVIATHGRTGIMHSLLGSVAEKVIQHSKCPVLVIPASEER
ncbi:MAG: universal stress protein [Ignavibacteria bacterium]|nr:universal stress protein [Ignavibacteria bacterium]